MEIKSCCLQPENYFSAPNPTYIMTSLTIDLIINKNHISLLISYLWSWPQWTDVIRWLSRSGILCTVLLLTYCSPSTIRLPHCPYALLPILNTPSLSVNATRCALPADTDINCVECDFREISIGAGTNTNPNPWFLRGSWYPT